MWRSSSPHFVKITSVKILKITSVKIFFFFKIFEDRCFPLFSDDLFFSLFRRNRFLLNFVKIGFSQYFVSMFNFLYVKTRNANPLSDRRIPVHQSTIVFLPWQPSMTQASTCARQIAGRVWLLTPIHISCSALQITTAFHYCWSGRIRWRYFGLWYLQL